MSMIATFNKAIPSSIDRTSELYEVWFGTVDFEPEVEITQSSDINCGALCNELEFARVVSEYHAQSFDVDIAEADNLEGLFNTLIDLPRNNAAEPDSTYRKRFRFIVNERVNYSRTTKHAIKDAVSYFVPDDDVIQVIELFDISNLYFEVRLEGISAFEDVIFMNNPDTAYIDQNFIGGPSIGTVVSSIGSLIERIRAVGVDFDVTFITQDRLALASDCIIGSVQLYLSAGGHIIRVESMTLTADAEVTT